MSPPAVAATEEEEEEVPSETDADIVEPRSSGGKLRSGADGFCSCCCWARNSGGICDRDCDWVSCLATTANCPARFFSNCFVPTSIVSKGTLSLSASSSIVGALPI